MGTKAPKKVTSYLSGFLRVLNKPQKPYFPIYLVGLIWLIKFRSIREIASQVGQGHVDGLHQFIKGSAKKVQKLQDQNQRQIAKKQTKPGGLLILDDTASARRGKKIDGLGVCHGANGFFKGLCAVTSILKVGSQRFMWAIRGYRPKKTCSKKMPFKSKIQLAVEILKEAIGQFRHPLTVLMDAWYACAPILTLIQGAGWTFLAAVKRNRIFYVGNRRTSVGRLAKAPRTYKTVRLTKKIRFRVARLKVHLPKVGTVLLFISKGKDGTRAFITNNLKMTERQMVALYSQRVWIETFHQDIKQHLGFGEMFMRSWTGVQTHWTLVGIAYNMIALWNGNRSRSFRQMIRHFRDAVDHKDLLALPKRLKPYV